MVTDCPDFASCGVYMGTIFIVPEIREGFPRPAKRDAKQGDATFTSNATFAGARCLVIGHAPYDGFQEVNIFEIAFMSWYPISFYCS